MLSVNDNPIFIPIGSKHQIIIEAKIEIIVGIKSRKVSTLNIAISTYTPKQKKNIKLILYFSFV